jgi:hypothetical protein
VLNDPETGKYVAISPKLVIKKYTINPIKQYANNAPPGPAALIEEPLARNNPVPIEPPIEIIVKCLALKLLFSVSCPVVASTDSFLRELVCPILVASFFFLYELIFTRKKGRIKC